MGRQQDPEHPTPAPRPYVTHHAPAPDTGQDPEEAARAAWEAFQAANPERARLILFHRDVMAAHPLSRDGNGVYVCRCGMVAEYCPVHRAEVRHGLVDPDTLPWQPLPEDLPARGSGFWPRSWVSA